VHPPLRLLARAAGEVLNCNCYDIALHTAVELQADKLIFMRCEGPRWQPPIWPSIRGMHAAPEACMGLLSLLGGSS
jgi:hypothetical protein